MCETCGCGQASVALQGHQDHPHHTDGDGEHLHHPHGHGAGGEHHHHHHGDGEHHHHHHHGDGEHHHHHHHGDGEHHHHDLDEATRRVELGQAVLAHNDGLAAANRRWLDAHGVKMLDLISSPGSGKTALLEATLDALAERLRVAVLVGDVRTDNDARRLAERGAVVQQIETGGACHLDANDIGRRLPEIAGGGLDLLVVENVGNLVCPAAFDLGQHLRVALLSVTEGEDKPLKYPGLFHRAPVVVITKIDLVPHLRWDREACLAAIRKVRPDARIIELSAYTGEGMAAWLELLTGDW